MVRAVLVSAGLLLLGTALGVILAERTDWVPSVSAIAVLCFGLAGVLSIRAVSSRIPALRTQEDRDDILRAELGRDLLAGRSLLAEVQSLTDDQDRIEWARVRAEQWATRVVAVLDKHRSGWSALFLSDPIHIQTATRYVERDKVRNWLAQRVAALRDLLERLG